MSEIDLRTLDCMTPRFCVALPMVGDPDVTLSPENSPVERRLVADLVVIYDFDFDTHFQIVAHRDLPHLAGTAEELHERALENLRAINLEVRAHQGEGLWLITAGGNYEATPIRQIFPPFVARARKRWRMSTSHGRGSFCVGMAKRGRNLKAMPTNMAAFSAAMLRA